MDNSILEEWKEILRVNSQILTAIYKSESEFKSKFTPMCKEYDIERMSFDSSKLVITFMDDCLANTFNVYVDSWDVVLWLSKNNLLLEN